MRARELARLRGIRAVLASVLAVCLVISLGVLSAPMDAGRYLDARPSGELADRNDRTLYAFLNRDEQWCLVRDLDELGSRIVQATLAAEDQRFYGHWGVDPIAVLRALWQDARHGKVVSGGSTITMQVVKLRDGIQRSAKWKVVQALWALRLERAADKKAILTAYLNIAPYGLNLVGAEAASRRYFGKSARELTISEAALIAALPKSPNKLMPLAHGERARARRNYVLRRMCDDGFISKGELEQALSEPLGVNWHEFPALAPHLAMSLRREIGPGGRKVVTLDAAVQEHAEETVARYMKRYHGDIGNAAVMVVNVPSGSVLARVGSADFYGTPGGGQVDACRALRAPGSALKPFTYALAMERGVLYASEALLDDSIDFGMYSPKNYDGDYNGLLSAGDALRHSLNVPAVMVLDRIGPDGLQKLLESAGLSTLVRSPEEYGLGLTLGDCEVRLDEMMGAYCMLASLGAYRPLRLAVDSAKAEPKTLLSRGTCLELYEMLEQTLPNELEPNLIRPNAETRVCWKTGTSTGHHDAWAFVFNRQYLVGAWLGNNSGRASERLVGIQAALPLAAKVFRSLPVSNEAAWPHAGEDLREVRVCAVSGLPASRWCVRTREEWFPREQYVNRVCDVHCPLARKPCARDSGRVDGEVYERWPGSAKGWDLAKVSAVAPLARKPCAGRAAREEALCARSLLIREPANSGEYVLTGEPNGDRVRLASSLDAESALYWYLDERFLGMSSPDKPLLMDLKAGSHTLACMTLDGKACGRGAGSLDRVSFKVTEAPSRVSSGDLEAPKVP